MAKYCYIPMPENNGNHRVVKLIENQAGYFPLGKANPNDPHEIDKFIGNYNQVKIICDMWNKHLNLNEKQIDKIVFKSMKMEADNG